MPLSDYLPALDNNPYFSAGFGLVGVGAGLSVLRKGAQAGFIVFRRTCMMTLEVPNKDISYNWLMQWLTQRQAKHTQHLSVMTTFHQNETGKVYTHFDYTPSPGVHIFRYQNYWIRAERTREQGMMNVNTGQPWESFTLTTVGRRKEIFDEMLAEAKELALSKYVGMTKMFVPMGPEWRQFGHPRTRRPLNSVILDDGIAENILSDVKDFIQNQSWYMDRGIPYRRGYLLHGPPGCGKTSFINALAGELEYSICVMSLSDPSLSDDRLNHLMSIAPPQSIILLEDIDSAFGSREDKGERSGGYPNYVSFSGLLNCLDGVVSTEERLVFMTTNYLDRLDPALIRPGRVDCKQLIDTASKSQLRRMFLRFYPEASVEDGVRFSDSLDSTGVRYSIAQIQGYLMEHKNDHIGALKDLEVLK